MIPFRYSAALVAAVLATSVGCGGKSKPKDGPKAEAPEAGPKEPPPVRKVTHIGLEYVSNESDPEKPSSRVSLIFTNETGARLREEIGMYDGGCSDVSRAARAEAMKPILGLDCWSGDSGVMLRFAHRKHKLYVVIAEVNRESPEPSYRPLRTIDLPLAPVVTDYDDPAAAKTP